MKCVLSGTVRDRRCCDGKGEKEVNITRPAIAFVACSVTSQRACSPGRFDSRFITALKLPGSPLHWRGRTTQCWDIMQYNSVQCSRIQYEVMQYNRIPYKYYDTIRYSVRY